MSRGHDVDLAIAELHAEVDRRAVAEAMQRAADDVLRKLGVDPTGAMAVKVECSGAALRVHDELLAAQLKRAVAGDDDPEAP